MANHKSAKKRAIQSETRRKRNMIVKTKVKNAIKAFTESPVETAGAAMTNVQSVIAKAAKKGVIHKKTAARKTSRLAKMANRLSAQ